MSSNVWHDSDPSDEEGSNRAATRKRSSRACDQCRKTKSKCDRSPNDSDICKNCTLSGNVCTYLGPSYKRGPPKGYIHAIEQRWQSIESLLGAVLASPDPGVQDLLAGLRQDDLARDILNRVDSGPFGPSGRLTQPAGSTKEDIFAQLFKSNESASNRDNARQRRQSRISREVVSSRQDQIPLVVPTLEWQDRISKTIRIPATTESTLPSHSSTFGLNGTPLNQRRRTDDTLFQPEWNNMYTIRPPSDSEDVSNSDGAEGVGRLSLDENSEIRYHGKSSGLYLISRSDRRDERNEGGIWRLPMARVWPQAVNCGNYFLQEEDIPVDMPDIVEQERLIELYFTYVHPAFPVVHKGHFIAQFNASKEGAAYSGSPREISSTPSPPRSDIPPPVSKLLVLSMLAIGARYTTKNVEPIPPDRKMWDGGCKYVNAAREVLNKVVHHSKPSTCQALLILGHREFGIGSMEQGWIYIGLAIRMATDLGLNRNADKWQYKGADLFSPSEKQMRKQVWYGCIMADEYSSVYMGRPVTISESDYDTLQPDTAQVEEGIPWIPASCDPIQPSDRPLGPSRIISCFRAAASLSIIVASIVTKIYPVKCHRGIPRSKWLKELESRLDHWYIQLPDALRYDSITKRVIPPPHVLLLHIKYWSAVSLLHRAFLPNWKSERQAHVSTETRTTGLKAFDLCQTAASHVSSIVTVYHEHYNLRRASPFLSAYLLNAGVTHVVTLTVRPLNKQASLGLRECLTALKEMEVIWPSARRVWDLLDGVKVQFDNAGPMLRGDDRRKRPAEDAFGLDKASDVLSQDIFGPDQVDFQDMSTRIMAQMLGLDMPGMEPSTSYLPGYEWWPRQEALSPQSGTAQQTLEGWLQSIGEYNNYNFST